MQMNKCILLGLTIFCIGTAQASVKSVNLPFYNEPIFSKTHSGLQFTYDLQIRNKESFTKKIVCELSYVYKGWLEFYNGEQVNQSQTYGNADGVDALTLTNIGLTTDNQYHVNDQGSVKINAVEHEDALNATASCRYEYDYLNKSK